MVHTVTAANRLADILPVFDSDPRVQVVYTCPWASAVTNGVEQHLAAIGALVMPWEQVVATEFDLALSVHNSGNLHDINAPLIILSHGMGYTKYSPGNRETGKPGNRETGKPGNRSVYGLSREWLVHDDAVVPSAIVLSHDEQHARLAVAVPEALDSALIAGDPCLDRMIVSEPGRHRYRHALGADDDTTIVLVTSTWGPDSLLGRNPDLIAQLLAELPTDRYTVVAALHPNTWFGHGPAQIRLWLGDCLRAGLRLVPPAEGWQQAVLASDVAIGDHGAVTAYAAAVQRAVLLASFPGHQVAAGSAVEALGRAARRLDLLSPFAAQLDAAVGAAAEFTEVRELASSLPGQSAGRLRNLFYELMGLPEPGRAPLVAPYAPTALVPDQSQVEAWWVTADWCEQEVAVARWPADVDARPEHPPNNHDRHLVVHHRHPRRDLYGNAAIVLLDHPDEAEAVFADRPACTLAVAGARVMHRDGGIASIALPETAKTAESAFIACASAIRTWLSDGRTWQSLPKSITVRLGARPVQATITVHSGQ
ncbi:hypothetical protein [Promicromonospora sp. NFX87]|uniref:hypothetical protein n=1 Tax=Promicromonospora sp. NFX87 TaxID=3402691 RepID=UPI003AFB11EB